MIHVLTLTYVQPADVIDQTRPAHAAWVKQHVDTGLLLLAGRQESGAGGVLITSDVDPSVADDLVATDPYQIAGLVSYQRSSFNATQRAAGL